MYVGIGEMPTAGLAGASSRQATAAAAAASAFLAQQQKDMEKQQRAAEEAKRKAETRELDPLLFPFEEYFFVELPATRAAARRAAIERALALPPGEYDVYVGLIDRARAQDVERRRSCTARSRVPDFWNDQLALSRLMLARDVRPLKAAFAGAAAGRASVRVRPGRGGPGAGARVHDRRGAHVVYQMCNYGAPDSDLAAELHVLSRRRHAHAVQPDRRRSCSGRQRPAAGRRLGIAGVRVADRAAAAVSAGAATSWRSRCGTA